MIYLAMSIVLSASMGIIFRTQSNKRINIYAVTTISYIVSFSVIGFMVISEKLLAGLSFGYITSFVDEFSSVILSNTGLFTTEASIIWAIILGSITGVVYCFGFILLQTNIHKNGIAITNIYMKSSIIIPLTISLLVWRELPTTFQTIGMIMCVVAIVLSNISPDKHTKMKINYLLLAMFLVGGLGEFSSKLFQKYAIIDFKNVYLLFIFLVAFLVSLIFLFINNRKFASREIIVAIAVGLPNLFTSFFMVLALNYINTSTAYLISSASTITIALLAAWLVFREELNRNQVIAIIITIISIILINI